MADDRRGAGPARSSLRGAEVTVDARRVARTATKVVMGALVLAAVLLALSAHHQNRIRSELSRAGVPVQVRVTSCLGLLGGSGSNAAGYLCRGVYRLNGTGHAVALPDGRLHARGAPVRVVVVPGDPALTATPAQLAHNRPSAWPYLVPGALPWRPSSWAV